MSNDTRNQGLWDKIENGRNSMKCPEFYEVMQNSDQSKELPQPPLCKEASDAFITISANFEDVIKKDSYAELLDIRRSERVYDKNAAMTQEQLAFMLWSSQGIQEIRGENHCTMRPAPSGGARHPFETYVVVQNVEDLSPGVYRYLPLEHVGEKRVSIEFVSEFENNQQHISDMVVGQKWAVTAPIVIIYSCVAYRAEWRYSTLSHRVALIDLGHVGQNLMLSAAALGLGSCNMAAYDQKLCDEALGLDGYEEYTVYVNPVGKVSG